MMKLKDDRKAWFQYECFGSAPRKGQFEADSFADAKRQVVNELNLHGVHEEQWQLVPEKTVLPSGFPDIDEDFTEPYDEYVWELNLLNARYTRIIVYTLVKRQDGNS